MKKLLLILTLSLASTAYSQVASTKVISELKSGNFSIKRMHDVYSICFEDQNAPKKKTIKCFSFVGDATKLKEIYNEIIMGYGSKEKTRIVKLSIPNTDVSVIFHKKDLHFEMYDNVSLKPAISEEIDKKDLDKLFGLD